MQSKRHYLTKLTLAKVSHQTVWNSHNAVNKFKSPYIFKTAHIGLSSDSLPVSVEGDDYVGRGGADASEGAHYPKDLTAPLAKRKALLEGVVDKHWCLQHHYKVTQRKVHNKQVGRRSQVFCSESFNKCFSKVTVSYRHKKFKINSIWE